MSQTPVSPAQSANPFFFHAQQLKRAVLALDAACAGSAASLPADITALISQATAAAVHFKGAAEDGQRFHLLTADNEATRDESLAVAVLDHLTGLTWQIKSSAKRYSNNGDADEYARSLTTLGHTDWRVPTELELLSIRDADAYKPAVYAPFRAGVRATWHWSSSPDPESAGCARYVSFYNGDSSVGNRDVGNHVLACRGGVGAVGGVSPGQ